jgi:hypothetical protein
MIIKMFSSLIKKNMNQNFRKSSFMLLLLCSSLACNAQKTYSLHWQTDLSIAGLGLTIGTLGWSFGKTVKPLQPAQLSLLDRNDVFPIDWKATYLFSEKAAHTSDVLFYAATITPFLLLADPKIRKEAGVVSVLYVETLTLASGLTLMTKNLAKRPRPYTYNPDAPMQHFNRPLI